MSWQVGLVCNAVISVAYFLIVLAIVVPLVKSHQLRSNPLGAATAAIFFTCAVHHGAHTLHMLMPYFGVDEVQGMAMREAWGLAAGALGPRRRGRRRLLPGPCDATTPR